MALEFLAVLFATLTVIATVRNSGSLRIFWAGTAVGATCGAVAALAWVVWLPTSALLAPEKMMLRFLASSLSVLLPAFWLLAPASGFFCALVHHLFLRGRDDAH